MDRQECLSYLVLDQSCEGKFTTEAHHSRNQRHFSCKGAETQSRSWIQILFFVFAPFGGELQCRPWMSFLSTRLSLGRSILMPSFLSLR
jgi:hypothetical protein